MVRLLNRRIGRRNEKREKTNIAETRVEHRLSIPHTPFGEFSLRPYIFNCF
jgi:hypothetical protein